MDTVLKILALVTTNYYSKVVIFYTCYIYLLFSVYKVNSENLDYSTFNVEKVPSYISLGDDSKDEVTIFEKPTMDCFIEAIEKYPTFINNNNKMVQLIWRSWFLIPVLFILPWKSLHVPCILLAVEYLAKLFQ